MWNHPPAGNFPPRTTTPSWDPHATQPPRPAARPSTPALGVIQGLFDLSLTKFITLRAARILYAVLLGGIVFGAAWGSHTAWMAFQNGDLLQCVGTLLLTPLLTFAYALSARLSTELLVVLFRIHDALQELVRNTDRAG